MGACDSGVQERTVTCVSSKMAYNVLLTSVTWHSSETTPEINTTSIEQEVYETDCSAETKPAGSRLCMLQSECPFWFRGPWSSVSARVSSLILINRIVTVKCDKYMARELF